MTKEEALKMAIVALEDYPYEHRTAKMDDALQACKEALEQPLTRDWKETIDERIAKDDEFKQALAQPAQEPVAWIKKTWCPELDWYDDFKSGAFADETDKEGWIPLYTHPAPSWQGLSDDEIAKIIGKGAFYEWNDVEFARAIEQASKEKST